MSVIKPMLPVRTSTGHIFVEVSEDSSDSMGRDAAEDKSAQFGEISDPILHYLAGLFGRTGLVLHGGTPVKKRQKIVKLFQR